MPMDPRSSSLRAIAPPHGSGIGRGRSASERFPIPAVSCSKAAATCALASSRPAGGGEGSPGCSGMGDAVTERAAPIICRSTLVSGSWNKDEWRRTPLEAVAYEEGERRAWAAERLAEFDLTG